MNGVLKDLWWWKHFKAFLQWCISSSWSWKSLLTLLLWGQASCFNKAALWTIADEPISFLTFANFNFTFPLVLCAPECVSKRMFAFASSGCSWPKMKWSKISNARVPLRYDMLVGRKVDNNNFMFSLFYRCSSWTTE